jgi:hypoxanthine phosphoribosyltransferase
LEKEILFPKDIIQKRVSELAQEISANYEGKEPVLIGILKGAIFFISDLAREMTIPIKMDFIRAASYGSETSSSGSIKVTKDIEIPVEGKPVIIVEDIVDTGLTLKHLMGTFEQKNVGSVEICALIDKLERRSEGIKIDYLGFQIEEGFIVGYGLDYDEKYRHLPEIYTLR